MKEESIRPEHLYREAFRRHAEDLQIVLAHRDRFVQVDCPACGYSKKEPAFLKDTFTFVSCARCETLFVDPRPTQEQLGDFYSRSEETKYWNTHIFPASEDARRNHIFAPRAQRVVDLCQKHGIHGGFLLDVGAGFGTFCEEVAKLKTFKRVAAVEPSPELAATCREKGIETIEKPIEDARFNDEINVITNFELIEHLFEPSGFLRACKKVLSPGGLLILTTPNIRGFDLKMLGPKSDNIGAPAHLNYFHPASLSLLLENCGFEVIEVATPGKLDAEIVRKRALAGDVDLSKDPFLKHVLLEQWESIGDSFQEFLVENRLSSHMWIVAKVAS